MVSFEGRYITGNTSASENCLRDVWWIPIKQNYKVGKVALWKKLCEVLYDNYNSIR